MYDSLRYIRCDYADSNINFWLETYSAESVCFQHKNERWRMKSKNSSKPDSTYGSKGEGCYRVYNVGNGICLQCVIQKLFNNIKILNIPFVYALLPLLH